MNKLNVLSIAGALALFTSCGDASTKQQEHSSSDGHEGHMHDSAMYACPMHPEMTGSMGDKCGKCGMDMVPMKTEKTAVEYVMTMRSEPQTMSAQQKGSFFFTPHVKGKDAEKVPLDVVHDKKIHLISVSNDLSYFDHIHPEFQANGEYKIEVSDAAGVNAIGLGHSTTQFPGGGDYTLFADYMPTGADHQLEKFNVHVDGKTQPSKTWSKQNLVSKSGDFVVTLVPAVGKFLTGQTSHIDAPLLLKGKSITTAELDDFLGAKAHMVVISVDDKSYLHVHPEVHEGVLDLHAYFEKPGFYRGWIQFSYKGELHTADFVIQVEQGTGNTEKQLEHKH